MAPWSEVCRSVVAAAILAGALVTSLARAELPAGSEVRLNDVSVGPQWRPAVAGNPSGGFAAAWSLPIEFGGTIARRFDGAAAPLDTDVRFDTFAPYAQAPAVAVDATPSQPSGSPN
jgi:hypothetical protein